MQKKRTLVHGQVGRAYSRIFGMRQSCIICMLFVFVLPLSIHATDITWNAGDGYWTNSANWTPAQVPGSSDKSFIGSVATCRVDAVVTVMSNFVSNAATLIIEPSGALTVTTDGRWSAGTIIVNGGTFTNTATAAFNTTVWTLIVSNGASFYNSQWIREIGYFSLIVDNAQAVFASASETWNGGRTQNIAVRNGGSLRFSNNSWALQIPEGTNYLTVEGSDCVVDVGKIQLGANTKLFDVTFVADASGLSTITNRTVFNLADSTNSVITINGSNYVGDASTFVLFDCGTFDSGVFLATNLLGCTGDIVYDYAGDEIRIENFRGPPGPVFSIQ